VFTEASGKDTEPVAQPVISRTAVVQAIVSRKKAEALLILASGQIGPSITRQDRDGSR
jgi:hypothetical protein